MFFFVPTILYTRPIKVVIVFSLLIFFYIKIKKNKNQLPTDNVSAQRVNRIRFTQKTSVEKIGILEKVHVHLPRMSRHKRSVEKIRFIRFSSNESHYVEKPKKTTMCHVNSENRMVVNVVFKAICLISINRPVEVDQIS